MRENPSSARDTSDSMKQNINVPCILGKISFDTSQKRFMPKSFNNWSQIDARSMQDLTSAFFTISWNKVVVLIRQTNSTENY